MQLVGIIVFWSYLLVDSELLYARPFKVTLLDFIQSLSLNSSTSEVLLVFFQVIYTSFGGSPKGLHFNNLIVGLVLLTRGRDEEKSKCT